MARWEVEIVTVRMLTVISTISRECSAGGGRYAGWFSFFFFCFIFTFLEVMEFAVVILLLLIVSSMFLYLLILF